MVQCRGCDDCGIYGCYSCCSFEGGFGALVTQLSNHTGVFDQPVHHRMAIGIRTLCTAVGYPHAQFLGTIPSNIDITLAICQFELAETK